jgi:hypothetical protein
MEEYGAQRKSVVNNKVKLGIPQTARNFFFRMKIGRADCPETSEALTINAA